MRIASEHILNRTLALKTEESALAAIAAMSPPLHIAEAEGLAEIVLARSPAKVTLAAMQKLASCASPLADEAFNVALSSSFTSVRIAAMRALTASAAIYRNELLEILRTDHSWMVRREVVRALLAVDDPPVVDLFCAADDPHWRVRHALIVGMLSHDVSGRRWIASVKNVSDAEDPRTVGLLAYLEFRIDATEPTHFPPPPQPESWCPFWSWDAAVLARMLDVLGREGRADAIDVMPTLAAHDDARVRRLALKSIDSDGKPHQLAATVALLDEPRRAAIADVRKFLSRLDLDRTAATIREILDLPSPTPAQNCWAIEQTQAAFPAEEAVTTALRMIERFDELDSMGRMALARLAAELPDEHLQIWVGEQLGTCDDPAFQFPALNRLDVEDRRISDQRLDRLAQSPAADVRAATIRWLIRCSRASALEHLSRDKSALVRETLARELIASQNASAPTILKQLQRDWHPHVRAAALTEDSALRLLENPMQETSWHVLGRAAGLSKTPIWNIEPEPRWQPPQAEPGERIEFSIAANAAPQTQTQTLGPAKLPIAPLGVSGHYGLPAAGFAKALEAGVNLMFWEPGYQTLNEFTASLAPRVRRQIHFMTGTFHADANNLRGDLERCLKHLRIERLDLFLIFWVQSWDRITDEMRRELEVQQQAGKLTMFGLSTHNRPLAVEAMHSGWDPIMARHSAAHRGAEELVLPTAVETGATLISFNNTSYGRLLGEHDGRAAPPISAADCYRYTLAQPGVTACLTAPSTLDELSENLTVLEDLHLSAEEISAIRDYGDVVYREDTLFRKLVRAL